MSSTENIILKSSDGEFVEVEETVALQSRTIRHMIEESGVPDNPVPLPNVTGKILSNVNPVPLPNVTGKILSKVIEYCKVHANADRASSVAGDDLKAWDAEFVKVDRATLFDLILAANYLDIDGLLDLTCQTVADSLKGKTPEEIRKTLNINNKFTPEEEEEVRRENPWAFE